MVTILPRSFLSALGAGALTATAAPPDGDTGASQAAVVDELPNAAEEKRRALREVALKQVISGKAKPTRRGASTVVKLGSKAPGGEDQYVELAREKTDKIFVVLAEFGDERHPSYPDQDTDKDIPGPATFNGPLHNRIPAPDRSKDNSTIWQADYNRQHFEQMYFGEGEGVESVKTYFERQSSERYSVEGLVTDWVKVRYNEARYGRSDGYPCADNVCSNTWSLIRDAVGTWVADGYIDHFQIVHSGGDQADGDPQQGEDAIWSHRWKAYQGDIGRTGPAFNRDGGTQIGETGLWIADYTIQPENGGLSVFAHEYGHDLGLPDHYQNGLLVSYWDTKYSDSNTVEHPGEGEILPIDSHPQPIYRLDGKPWRGRIQTYDAPFGLEKADSFTLHAQETGQASYIRGQDAQPVFDDRRSYWNPVLPAVGVKVPNAGVRMQVQSASGTSMKVRISSTE